MSLYDELKLFSKVGFREIYKKWIYIHCRDILEMMMPGKIDDSITGVIAYCYIDRTEGLSFRPIMIASMKPDTLQVFVYPNHEDTIYVLRFRENKGEMSELHDHGKHMYLYSLNTESHEFFDLSIVNFDVDSFVEIKKDIDEIYGAGEMVEVLRSKEFAFLDRFRHKWYPDDVKALLVNKEGDIEQVWVRLTFMTQDNEIFGELLNLPYKDYGCHEGTLIELKKVDSGDDSVLVFTGRMATKK